jgi:hypothetical protein
MKSTKILAVLVIILVAITFLGIVSAAEVTVGSQKFNIPDGYKENTTNAKERSSSTDVPNTNQGINTKSAYKSFSNGTNYISINVVDIEGGSGNPVLSNEPGYENKTIGGIDGMYNPDTKCFRYVKDGSIMIVAAPDEKTMEEIIT